MTVRPLKLALVAGEPSGDALGGRLMAAIGDCTDRPVSFFGVGGERMEEQGLNSLFPLSETALMGPFAIAARLPRLVRLVHRTVNEIVAFVPDALVLIDSPEFTHAVGKRVRRKLPGLPIVDYVSPTVWAWRPGRARAMRAYVDHVAAIFPFEPAVHERLGGPPCTYVGHPAVERLHEVPERSCNGTARPTLLVLPGSRSTEIERLLPIFGRTLGEMRRRGGEFDALLPAVPHLADRIEREVAGWPVPVRVVRGEQAKWNAFAEGTAALAASGTVTLELALAGVPMVVAYRLDPITARLRRLMLRLPSVVMANLVLGENAFPEFIHDGCTPENLAEALLPLLSDTPQRRAQLDAARRVRELTDPGDVSPSRKAAMLVLQLAGARSGA